MRSEPCTCEVCRKGRERRGPEMDGKSTLNAYTKGKDDAWHIGRRIEDIEVAIWQLKNNGLGNVYRDFVVELLEEDVDQLRKRDAR